MENIDTTATTPLPFGRLVRVVDHLIAREFDTAFRAEDVSRRDMRLLTLLADDTTAPAVTARMARHGSKKLHRLAERGWITQVDGAWRLSDEGRAAQARLGAAVSDEDFATTTASLEAIARELGWDPDERTPRPGRGFGPHRHGSGPGFRGGFGPGFGGHGFGPGGRHAGQAHAERAFERGFEAGFSRGAASHEASRGA
ncbi:hypothetical protein [Microbacterium flavum]|uniref:hypothetical protein n=1 Tax=Microbacterium flavum TaxID=415216 RepID=UPI0024ADA52C|nr:hypothetical protein [Microbacterium flavum]